MSHLATSLYTNASSRWTSIESAFEEIINNIQSSTDNSTTIKEAHVSAQPVIPDENPTRQILPLPAQCEVSDASSENAYDDECTENLLKDEVALGPLMTLDAMARSPSPVMRRSKMNTPSFVSSLSEAVSKAAISIPVSAAPTHGQLLMYFSDCQQAGIRYDTCLKALRKIGSLAIKEYWNTVKDAKLDARIVYGGDKFDSPTGIVSSRDVTHSLMQTNHVMSVEGKLRKDDVQHTALMSNRDLSRLRILREIPMAYDDGHENNIRETLSFQTVYRCEQWNSYNLLIGLLFPALYDSVEDWMGFNLLIYLKLVLITRMTMDTTYHSFVTLCIEDCGMENSTQRYLLVQLLTEGGVPKSGETVVEHAERLSNWVLEYSVNQGLLTLAGCVVNRAHAFISEYTLPSDANGTTRMTLRTFLEQYSGAFECVDVGSYRVIATRAMPIDYHQHTIILKYPHSIHNNPQPEPPSIHWEPLIIDETSDQDTIVEWCRSVNDQLRQMIRHIFAVHSGTSAYTETFEYQHKPPFHKTPPLVLSYSQVYLLVALLGGPSKQGMVSETVEPNQIKGSLSVPKMEMISSEKPTTWLLGDGMESVVEYQQFNNDEIVRACTSRDHSAFCVSAVVNDQIAHNLHMKLVSDNALHSKLATFTTNVPAFSDATNYRVVCGPRVILPDNTVHLEGDISENANSQHLARMVVVHRQNPQNTYLSFIDDSTLMKMAEDRSPIKDRCTFTCGMVSALIDQRLDLKTYPMIEAGPTGRMQVYDTVCNAHSMKLLKPSSEGHYNMMQSWRVPIYVNGMQMHALMIGYMCASNDKCLGREIKWDGELAQWQFAAKIN